MAKRQLFTEAIPCNLQLIETEANGQKLMKVRGVFHRADEKNANNRIYPSKLLERETKRLNDRLKESVFMQADHPADGMSKVSQTAAILSSVEYDPRTKEVMGEATILETSLGKDLAAIVRAGGHVGISARGFGTTTPGECAGQKGDVVNEDYQLGTFDFVVGQSTRNAVVSSFSEQDEALGGLSEGDEMDISKMNLEELKAARPDLFKAIEEVATKAAKAAAEQDVSTRVATMVADASEKIEAKLRDELKLEKTKARKDMTAAEKKAADAEDAADKGADETTEQYQARMAPKLEKAGLHIVKKDKDAAAGASAKVEAELTTVRTQLNEALQSLQKIGSKQKALDEQAQSIAVDKKIMEATKDEKKFRNALIERLRKTCTTIEEVDAKLPQERAAIERLLSETAGGHGNGATGKTEELGTNDGGEEKTFKTKSGLVLTERQVRERELSGIPTVLVD